MHALLPLLFFLAQPFWEAKTPDQWTALEVAELLHDSPWAQTVGPDPGVLVYFATGHIESWIQTDGGGKRLARPGGIAIALKARILYVVNSGDGSVASIPLPGRKGKR